MISSFKNFYKGTSSKDIVKPTKNSRKHSQSLNRNTIDRKKSLNFVPYSDRIKRINNIVKKFEANKSLKYLPITPEKANQIAKDYGLNISKENSDFSKSLKRTNLFLIRRGSKYLIVPKK
jgi:hypothetical protein